MLFSRLVTIAALLVSANASANDGFVKMDFNVLQGQNFQLAFTDFVNKVSSNVNNAASKLTLEAGKYSDLAVHSGSLGVFKRDGLGNEVTLNNDRIFYTTDIKFGSIGSKVQILIDTGSADLWVTGSQNPGCLSNGGTIDCSQYGTFAANSLTTWKDNHTKFSITYLDQTYANGEFGQDSIALSDKLKLDHANFAVAEDTNSSVSVFGIGFQDLESTSTPYENVPLGLKSSGLIKKNAYSLYLTSQEATTGSLLFGGIDHAKYSGELAEIDLLQEKGKYVHFEIPLNSITVELANNASSTKRSVIPANDVQPKGAADDIINDVQDNIRSVFSENGWPQPKMGKGFKTTLSTSSLPHSVDVPSPIYASSSSIHTTVTGSDFSTDISLSTSISGDASSTASISGSSSQITTPPSSSSSPSSSSVGSSSTVSSSSAGPSESGSSKIDTNGTPVVLDSGTTLTLLPVEVVQQILQQIDPNFQTDSGGNLYVNCSLAAPGNQLIYSFDGKDISVPFTNLVIPGGLDQQTNKQVCRFGILPGNVPILGDNFLRSCYTVFNLDDKKVSIAQIKYTDDTNIELLQ